MFTSLWDRWDRWPLWAKLASGAALVYAIIAVTRVWGESRPVGGFAEEMLAMVIVDGSLLGAFVGGIALGMFVAKKCPRQVWLGWLAGLVAFVAIGSIRYVAEAVPGVGWRVAQMNDAEPVEY
ncbi:hypothetical protein [Brevundimonas sp.]|uniref:hypothetical protein n=1 Tax=Brevundimonas sp. TaxID=1871086 RepID=UPI002FCC5DE4